MRPLGRRRGVAFRVNVDGSFGIRGGAEVLGNEHFQAAEIPFAPALVLESEQRLAGKYADDVDAHRPAQVLIDPAQHLIRLVDLDRALFQPVIIPKRGDAGNMNPGDRRRTEIHRHGGRVPVVERGTEPFP
jgi:hypothetical protein